MTVYEKLRGFRRLGDSLGLGENALKLLRRWGGDHLYTTLTKIGNQAPDMQIRRWGDGKILAQQPLMVCLSVSNSSIQAYRATGHGWIHWS